MTLIFVENSSNVDIRTFFEIKLFHEKYSSTLLKIFTLIPSGRNVVMMIEFLDIRHSSAERLTSLWSSM